MNILSRNEPPGNTLSVPLLRSPRTLRRLPVGSLVELLTIALDHGEHVASASIHDLRVELRRREDMVRP